MPRERDPPYVAAGFRNDAQALFAAFVAKESLKFADFAEIWRDLNFSTIFMGREGLRELTEFIEECYRNTLLFMDASNPYLKVGAVYLLFTLYMKQPPILKSQVQIRISYKQVWDIFNLESHFLDVASQDDNVLDLTYVITKLFKMEAFTISCFPIPMGPAVPMSLLRLEPLRSSCFKEMLGIVRMLNESDIKNICELCQRHDDLKKQLPVLCSNSYRDVGGPSKYEEMYKTIDELEFRYNAGLFPNEQVSGGAKIDEEFRTMGLGERRALLKSQQYERAAEFRKSKTVSVSSDCSESKSSAPPEKRRGRPKKLKTGRPGRKKKNVEGNVKVEPGAQSDGDWVTTAETEADDPQTDTEIVDCPEMPLQPVKFFPFRRRSKYPRPIRRHYFQDEEGEDE